MEIAPDSLCGRRHRFLKLNFLLLSQARFTLLIFIASAGHRVIFLPASLLHNFEIVLINLFIDPLATFMVRRLALLAIAIVIVSICLKFFIVFVSHKS